MPVAMLAVAFATLLAAPRADAAAPWLAPVDISAPSAQPVFYKAIAVARDGATDVIWVQRDGTHNRVWAASRAPGAAGFTRLAAPLSPAGQHADSPQIAVDRQGTVTAAWRRCPTASCVVQAAIKPAGGAWRAPVDVSDTSGKADSLDLAVGENRNAILAWRNVSSTARVEVAIRSAGSDVFASRSFISPATDATSLCGPRVAMDAAGDAIALWQRYYDPDGAGPGGSVWVMESNERSAGGSFGVAGDPRSSTSQAPGVGANTCQYDVVMTPEGRGFAIWDYKNGGTADGSKFVEYADRVPGSDFATGSWSPRGRASASNQDAFLPLAGLDDDGNAVAAWSAFNGSNWIVQASTRQGIGGWGPRADLSGPGGLYTPSLASSANGDALIAWVGSAGANPAIFGARLIAGGAFTGIGTATVGSSSTSYGDPTVALDGQGNGFAVFGRTVNEGGTLTYTLQAAGIDPVAPSLALTVPATGTVGRPVAMTAQGADRMSPVTVDWSFGDGGTASGTAVSHTYGAPGTYTVTATASDQAGNATKSSRTVSVTAPPPVDADGDGFPADVDCRDDDPRINPGAKEIPGNDVDENCDGIAAPFPDLRSKVRPSWSLRGNTVTLQRFRLKGLKPGWKVTVSCTGKGCPFKTLRIKNKKVKKGSFDAIKRFGAERNRRFRAGQTITVKFTAPGYNARHAIFKLRKAKRPTSKVRCQTRGESKLRACR